MIYIANHMLVVGDGAKVKKGQQIPVAGLSESEITGLLEQRAITPIDGGEYVPATPASSVALQQKDDEIALLRKRIAALEATQTDETAVADAARWTIPQDGIYAGKTAGDCVRMWKFINKEAIVQLLEENDEFGYSTDMLAADLIKPLVAKSIAPPARKSGEGK